jgi:hypothetical protein
MIGSSQVCLEFLASLLYTVEEHLICCDEIKRPEWQKLQTLVSLDAKK